MNKIDREASLAKLFTPRENYKPFEYPEYGKIWEDQSNAFWLHTKIPMASDVTDFHIKLTDVEKTIVEKILMGFSQTECEVGSNWNETIAQYFAPHEIKHAAYCFSYFETIHAQAYFFLNETLGLDKNVMAFLEDKTTRAKLDNLKDRSPLRKDGTVDYMALALNLSIFAGVGEGVCLYSSFAILLSFMPRNLLKGVSQQMTWSVRDESLHSNTGSHLFKQMVKEVPSLIETKELENKIREAFDLGLKLEIDFILSVFEIGALPNLSADQLINFMKYRCNDRFSALGFSGLLYDIDEDLLEQMTWFEMCTGSSQKKDFFVVKPSEYSKSTEDWSTAGLSLD